MSLEYELSSETIHISAKQLFLNWKLYRSVEKPARTQLFRVWGEREFCIDNLLFRIHRAI